jgi:excisionase family DNA binding protein
VKTMDIQFYRPDEIAKLLKVAPATPYKWIRDGLLPAHRLGRSLRISADDLTKFLKQRRPARKTPNYEEQHHKKEQLNVR